MRTDQIRLILEPLAATPSNGAFAMGTAPGRNTNDSALPASGKSASPGACAEAVVDAFPPALVVPPEPAWVYTQSGSLPRISVSKPATAQTSVLIELVTPRRQPNLLLSSSGRSQVYVNGLPALRFMLLKEKDVLRLNEAYLLHVCVYNQPVADAAGTLLAGKECPVCRVPLTAASRCYICAACGAAMHFEEGDEGLQCAQLRAQSGCPACQRPITLVPGYSYFPEVTSE